MANANLRKIKSGFIKTTDRHQSGVACVASVINFYGGSAELQRLHESSGAAKTGVSLFGLFKAAQTEGFNANGFKANIDALKGVQSPVILHVSKDSGDEDFVVVYAWNKNRFVVGDPQWGIIEYREDELAAIWKSNSLMLMEPDEGFQTVKEKQREKRLWLYGFFKNYSRVFITTGSLGILAALSLMLTFWIFYTNVLHTTTGKGLYNESVKTLIIFLFFIIVLHFKNVFVFQAAKNISIDLIARISKNIFRQNIDVGETSRTTINLFEKVAKDLSTYIANVLGNLPFYSILYIVSLIFIFIVSVWAGIIVLSGLVISLLITWFIQKKLGQLIDSENECFTEREKILNYNSQLIRNIKLVNREKGFALKNMNSLRSLLETRLNITLLKDQNKNWLFLLFTLLALILFGFVFDFGEDRSQIRWLAVGGWLTMGFFSIYRLSKLLADFNSAKTSYTIIYNRVGAEPLEEENVKGKDERRDIPTIKSLSVEDLEYAFPGQAPMFQGVKFEAKLGELTVVNGATGSGKSILVSLLARLLPIQKGVIKVNGSNWGKISDFNWKANISATVQPVQLFDGSVLENIGSSEKVLEPKHIISFCEKMGFDSFIKLFPNGYTTESGNLSAGQKQLISLAIALYRKPKLLLLDVPFVFMDEEMTKFSMELIRRLKYEMLIIIFNCSSKVKSKADSFFVYKMGNYIS